LHQTKTGKAWQFDIRVDRYGCAVEPSACGRWRVRRSQPRFPTIVPGCLTGFPPWRWIIAGVVWRHIVRH